MKLIKRLVQMIISLILIIIFLFFGIILYDSWFGSQTADFTNTTYTDDNGNLLVHRGISS